MIDDNSTDASADNRDSRLRILYVEDAIGFRDEMVKLHLRDAHVIALSSLAAARIFVASGESLDLDCALLDYELGDGTGAEVLRLLRARAPALLIIAVSADAGFNRILLEHGADLAFTKRQLRAHSDLIGTIRMHTRK